MLVTRYQDVIAELFWASSLLTEKGDMSALMEAALSMRKNHMRANANGLAFYDTVMRNILQTASPYYIETHVDDLIRSAAPELPLSTRMTPELWPTPAGWARVHDVRPAMHVSVGLAWAWGTVDPPSGSGKDTLRINNRELYGHILCVAGLLGVYPPVGNVTAIPLGLLLWPEGWTLGEVLDMYAHHPSITPEEMDSTEFNSRYAASLALFMDQRILETSHHHADRHTRRTLQRAAPAYAAPDVLVVRLRRVHHAHTHDSTTPLDHAFRWWVSGHWRTIHRDTTAQRTLWVRPHIKGPEGRPIKRPAMRVFEVER